MNLSPEQESLIRQWVAEGASLSDVQSRLASECDVHMSYLDVRFLLLDLNLSLVDKKTAPEQPAPVPESNAPANEPLPAEGEAFPADEPLPEEGEAFPADEPAAPAPGTVSVEISRIQRPGFALSGSLVCSDGVRGDWGVTPDGRIAFDFGPDNRTYKPSADDLRDFQLKLREMLSAGY